MSKILFLKMGQVLYAENRPDVNKSDLQSHEIKEFAKIINNDNVDLEFLTTKEVCETQSFDNVDGLQGSKFTNVYISSDKTDSFSYYSTKTKLNNVDVSELAKTYNDDDVLFMFNSISYIEDNDQAKLMCDAYNFINNFKGKLFFVSNDIRLGLKNCYLGGFYNNVINDNGYSTSRINIKSDVSKRITILTQCANVYKLKEDFYSKLTMLRKSGDYHNNVKDVKYMPLHAISCNYIPFKHGKEFKGFKYDLAIVFQDTNTLGIYRKYRLENYVRNLPNDLNICYIGRDSDDIIKNFNKIRKNPITIINTIKYDELRLFMYENVLSQLVLSEGDYLKYDLIPNRVFESISANVFPLIDECIDSRHSIIDDSWVYNDSGLYINNSEDVTNIINEIKENINKHSLTSDYIGDQFKLIRNKSPYIMHSDKNCNIKTILSNKIHKIIAES